MEITLTCKRCGNPFAYEWAGGSGAKPRYCIECKPIVKQETNSAGVRRFKERRRYKGPEVIIRFAMCSAEGCVFHPICRSSINDPRFDPHCFTTSKRHKLFVREYGAGTEMTI